MPSLYDHYEICEMCAEDPEACNCFTCPECGSVGDPMCYLPQIAGGHGLYINYLQYKGMTDFEQYAREDRLNQDRYWDDMFMSEVFKNDLFLIEYCNESHRECLLSIACAMTNQE